MPERVLVFWKTVGGYLSCVKYRGRWMFLTDSGLELLVWEREAKAKGYRIERWQGAMPISLAKLWAKHGATHKVLKERLPRFKW